jgi:hypothetical protein
MLFEATATAGNDTPRAGSLTDSWQIQEALPELKLASCPTGYAEAGPPAGMGFRSDSGITGLFSWAPAARPRALASSVAQRYPTFSRTRIFSPGTSTADDLLAGLSPRWRDDRRPVAVLVSAAAPDS